MRKWRNWQTRTFEGRVVHTVRVQVPFSAPKAKAAGTGWYPRLLYFPASRPAGARRYARRSARRIAPILGVVPYSSTPTR